MYRHLRLLFVCVVLTRFHLVVAGFYPEIWAPMFGGSAATDQIPLNDGPVLGLTASRAGCPIAVRSI